MKYLTLLALTLGLTACMTVAVSTNGKDMGINATTNGGAKIDPKLDADLNSEPKDKAEEKPATEAPPPPEPVE